MKRWLLFLVLLSLFTPGAYAATTSEIVSLDAFADLVIQNNKTLQSQQKTVEAAYYSVMAAVAYQRPNLAVSAQSSYLSGEEDLGVKQDNITAFNIGAALTQGIDISGSFSLDEQQQILYYEIQEASYEDSFNSLVAQARETYYSAIYAKDNVLLQQEILVQRVENLRVTNEKFRVGTVQKLDVIRAEAQVTEAESYIAQAQADYDNLLASMTEMAGGVPVSIGDAHLTLPLPAYVSSYDIAVARRPDVRSYTLARERARLVKKLTAKGLSPTLMAAVNWTPFADPWSSTTLQSGQVMGSLTLSVPIFDGNATKYDTMGADRLLQSAEASLGAVLDNTAMQLRVAGNNLAKSIVVEQYMRRQMQATAEELRITRERYLDGIGDQLDLLNAFTADRQSRTDHLSAVRDMHTALVELRRAMGDYAPYAPVALWRNAVKEYKNAK